MAMNNSEQISRYLQNEMSAEERTAFEKQLATDKSLQQELAIQKQIIAAVERGGLKATFGKTIRRKYIGRQLVRWGIVAVIITGLVFYALKTNMFSHSEGEGIGAVINKDAESFIIDNSADTIIETDEGVVFGIPANAFNSNSKKIRVEIKTAISPYKIMQQGLSTTSNGSLLQTAGMFYINGYEDERPLSLVKNIDVSVPATEINPEMKLFDGVLDGNGHINWINPTPIENNLRTYDITTLDFYPPNYIPILKALEKDYANKRYTDSLYYSFSGYQDDYSGKSLGGRIFYQKCGSCHVMGQEATGPNLQGVLSRWPHKQALKGWILNWQDAVKKYPYAANMANSFPAVQPAYVGQITDAELEFLIKWIDEWQPHSQTESITDTTKPFRDEIIGDVYRHYEIDPSRIKVIWDKKFNNTILATKEFEERLRFMHSLCDAKYLNVYLEALDTPIYVIDQYIADNSTGEIRKKFLEFASRKDGGVMLKEGMQEKLSNYFQQKYKAYREAAEKTWAKHREELARLNQIADNKRREQATRDYIREDKNFEEEFCINLTDAYRQIGVKRTCNDTIISPPPPVKYYNVTITTVGWKNLDVYVFDATTNRQSMTYTDPVSGKTARLTYKEVNISIENIEQYDKVLVYLIPDSLSTFQRLEQQGDVFKESMNLLFKYDAVAIGYKGTQTFFYRQPGLQPGSHVFRLSLTTEKELKDVLKNYSNQKSKEFETELEYQLFEQQEIVRQVQLRKEEEFREKVASAIFNCGEVGYGLPEKDRVYSK